MIRLKFRVESPTCSSERKIKDGVANPEISFKGIKKTDIIST